MLINNVLYFTYNSYICIMELQKQLIALSILNTGRYIIKEDKIYNRSGVELFKYSLPTNYIQCTLFNGKRCGKGEKIIIYKHVLIYLANNGTFNPSLVIGHMDNNNKNNHPSNLKAITQSENRLMSPPKNDRKKLIRMTDEQKETAINLFKSGLSQSSVAKKLGLERLTVRYYLANMVKVQKASNSIETQRLKEYLKTIRK
jgi:DNA-binding CsgD family transcriptional regulator